MMTWWMITYLAGVVITAVVGTIMWASSKRVERNATNDLPNYTRGYYGHDRTLSIIARSQREARLCARITFSAPIWPAVVVALALRGLHALAALGQRTIRAMMDDLRRPGR